MWQGGLGMKYGSSVLALGSHLVQGLMTEGYFRKGMVSVVPVENIVLCREGDM